jgi:hypothetical protein
MFPIMGAIYQSPLQHSSSIRRATMRTMRPNPIQRRAVLEAAHAEIEFDEGRFRILARADKKAAPEGAALPSSVLCLD